MAANKKGPAGGKGGKKKAGKAEARSERGVINAAPAGSLDGKSGPGLWTRAWPIIAVAFLPWLIYFMTLNAGFVWDDHNLIEMQPDNPTVSDFGKLWVSDFWQKAEQKTGSQYYRPLTTTTFLIDQALYGKAPRGYHATNIIIYSAVCVFAFLVMSELFGRRWLALMLALMFAANPAHTENVAWVSGRTDLVCAAFMFAALYVYLVADRKNDLRLFALSVALFALSLFGKEMSITMPAVVAVHAFFKRGGWKAPILRAVPFALAGAAYWVLHAAAATGTTPENVYQTTPAYLLNIVRNVALSVWHSLVPGGFDYLVTATREEAAKYFATPQDGALVFVIVIVALLAAAAVWSTCKRKALIGFGLLSGLITVAPVSGVIPIGVVYALRFLLIPSLFFTIALGAALKPLAGRNLTVMEFRAPWAGVVLAPAIIAYIVVSMARVPDWKSDAALMLSVLDDKPNVSLAHFLAGNGLASERKPAEALEHYYKAIENRDRYPEAHYNLGVLLQRAGRVREAEQHYRKTLEEKPDYMPARVALARLLQATGRHDQAVRIMREAPQN